MSIFKTRRFRPFDFTRTISAEMLTNYWTAIKELEGAVASKELKHRMK